jgi:hypothetical protein
MLAFASFDGKPFSSISILQVWDPPLAYDPIPLVKPATITARPSTISKISATASPGNAFTSYKSPDRTDSSPDHIDPRPGVLSQLRTQEAHEIPGVHFKDPQGLAPTAVITIGRSRITASILDHGTRLRFGSRTLYVGGPPLVTAGATFSLGEKGRLELGSGNAIHFAPQSGAFRPAGSDRIVLGESGKVKPGGAIIASGRPGGPGSITVVEQLEEGIPSGIAGGLKSDEIGGDALNFNNDPFDKENNGSGSTRNVTTKTLDVKTSEVLPERSGKKKSAAHNRIGMPQGVVLIFCCIIEMWWSMYAF